jgi:hypothetical protein
MILKIDIDNRNLIEDVIDKIHFKNDPEELYEIHKQIAFHVNNLIKLHNEILEPIDDKMNKKQLSEFDLLKAIQIISPLITFTLNTHLKYHYLNKKWDSIIHRGHANCKQC